MKKIGYFLIIISIITLFSCQTVEVSPRVETQPKISQIRDYLLTQSIYNLDSTPFSQFSMEYIIGDAYSNLELQKNLIPYLNKNLKQFEEEIRTAYIDSLFEIQQILILYSEKLDYPLLYPNADNKYIIEEKSSTILFEKYRDELYKEFNDILDKNLDTADFLYNEMASEYNIYCEGLENLNRPSPPIISTNILPRMKTVFIKLLLAELSKNELELGLINTPLDLNSITIY